jgi:ATP-dependent Lon protease
MAKRKKKIAYLDEIESSDDVRIPANPLERVIGQEHAVKIAKIAAKQRRHLLLVGAPGVGKSMLAQGISFLLPKPNYEISVLHNAKTPERPILEVRTREQVLKENDEKKEELGKIVEPKDAPVFVAEKLGFRCRRCGFISSSTLSYCPNCGADKHIGKNTISPFGDIIMGMQNEQVQTRIFATRTLPDGREEHYVYEKTPDDKIRVMRLDELKKERERSKKKRNIIVPLNRNPFVRTSGASETELLGDVKHDPYGGHPEIGTPPYMRVVPGAIHEAHEGVLYIDELSTLSELQRYLLTAMQEKKFPIVGRNSTSTGAVVRVDDVPCDFIFVGAVNINDLGSLFPALRSRIRGEGYEVLLRTWMEDNEENEARLAQFVAQEIKKDGKIPPMSKEGIKEIIKIARRWARQYDNAKGLTLRLRNLAGVIKLAGDLAIMDGVEMIDVKHIKEAMINGKSVEEQIQEMYGDWWKAAGADMGIKMKQGGTGIV